MHKMHESKISKYMFHILGERVAASAVAGGPPPTPLVAITFTLQRKH